MISKCCADSKARERAVDQVAALEEHLFQFFADFFELFLGGHSSD